MKQDLLPLFLDEGVFCIVAEIILQKYKEFKNIVPMMVKFHLAKAVQHCLGKLVKGTGFQCNFLETNVFGVKTVEAFILGSHYLR